MSLVIAFAGPTGAGKTTLVTALKEHYSSLIPIFHVAQDGFYKPDEQCEKVGEFYNWDVPSALFMEDFEKALETTCQEARQVAGASLVLVDGILLFSSPSLPDKYDAIIELHLEESCHRERRFQRDKWIQKNADYWDQIVMPAHAVHGRVPRPIHCHHAAIDASNTREEVLQSALRHIDAWRHHKQSRPSEQD